MNGKRIGQQTIELPSRPALCGSAAFVGRKEGEGPLGHCFDHVAKDEMYGQESFELAERQLYLDAIAMAVEKGRERIENVQFLLGGDLLNQIITASFSARELGVPFIGLYGACSTMSESLCLAGMLLDGGHAQQVVCAASSHFCTAERQYRYPLEFGSQRPPTAQWTVTGAGATLLCAEPKVSPLARLRRVCVGRVVDLGIADANNMGAAMAPAAADTLLSLFRDTQTGPADYDAIVTGDLGQVGHDLLMQLMRGAESAVDRRAISRLRPADLRPGTAGRSRRGKRLRLQRRRAERVLPAKAAKRRVGADHLYGHGRADEHYLQPAGRDHPRRGSRGGAGKSAKGEEGMNIVWMYLKVFLVGAHCRRRRAFDPFDK